MKGMNYGPFGNTKKYDPKFQEQRCPCGSAAGAERALAVARLVINTCAFGREGAAALLVPLRAARLLRLRAGGVGSNPRRHLAVHVHDQRPLLELVAPLEVAVAPRACNSTARVD